MKSIENDSYEEVKNAADVFLKSLTERHPTIEFVFGWTVNGAVGRTWRAKSFGAVWWMMELIKDQIKEASTLKTKKRKGSK